MEELQQKNEALEELNRIRDDFYSGLAHDIRSPLTSIKLVIEMLSGAKNLELDQRNLVQILVKNTMHLERITNELMEYIRLKKGELELKEDSFRLSDLISQLESEFEPLTKEKGIAITKQYDPDAEIIMDRYQITKVIRNLLENAIRYSFREGQIRITSKVQEHFWTFSVRDFGLGISKDDLAKLFTPFMRSRQAQEMHREGLGIGLMVCKRIIDLYEGTLWAASDGLNQGTQFNFQISLKRKST
jgi:signal transduction histidine kinase